MNTNENGVTGGQGLGDHAGNEWLMADGLLLRDARSIITSAQLNAVRSVEFHRVEMYWKLGERIFVEEQQELERAKYGAYLIANLAVELEREFGSGFSKRQLERARQFYRLYPIASALRSQLNWFQYRMLISISDAEKREYYELEAVKNHWTGKELERQINAQLYERLLLSNDKESVMAVARRERYPETAKQIIKDPMYLEFLGMESHAAFYEHYIDKPAASHHSPDKPFKPVPDGFEIAVSRQTLPSGETT